MNARIEAPASIALDVPHWAPEVERNILGAAMLGEPMPTWLASHHFFPTQHQRIYEAVQSVGGNVARVNAWLRDSSSKWGAPVATSSELAAMCLEARHALSMGWALEFDELRELWRQRELVTCMQRVAIRVRAGELSHREARAALSDHFGSCK